MNATGLKIKSPTLGKLICDVGGVFIRLNSPNTGNWAFKYKTEVEKSVSEGAIAKVAACHGITEE